MRPPIKQEEEQALYQAWSDVLGFPSLHSLGVDGLRYVGHGVRVMELAGDEFVGEVEIPGVLIGGRLKNCFVNYLGWVWMDTATFACVPWVPVRAWLKEAMTDTRFNREFARTATGGVTMSLDTIHSIVSGQLRLGRDEDGGVFSRGLGVLETRRRRPK